MSVKNDRWIRKMAREHDMINPFAESQVREGVISCGVSSYGYDLRVALVRGPAQDRKSPDTWCSCGRSDVRKQLCSIGEPRDGTPVCVADRRAAGWRYRVRLAAVDQLRTCSGDM